MEIFMFAAAFLLMTQVAAQLDEEERQILDRCYDVIPPSSQHPCWLQKLWGKCDVDWMLKGQRCAKTCERCLIFQGCSCTNVPPLNNVFIPCQQLAKDGYCDDTDFIQFNYCEYSCGQCKCPAAYLQLSPPPVSSPPPLTLPPPPSPPPPSPSSPPPRISSIFIDPTAPLSSLPYQDVQIVINPANIYYNYNQQQYLQQQSASAADQQNQLSQISVFAEEDEQGNEITNFLDFIVSSFDDNQQQQPKKCFSDLFIDDDCCSLMLSAVRAVGLNSTLDNDSTASTTIFVPTDKAFEDAIDYGINVTELINMDPPDLLMQLLGYHIVKGPQKVNDLRQKSQWTSFEKGWPIYVEITDDQRVLIQGQRGQPAQIKESDLQACDSIVQIITEVLIPEQLLPAQNPLYYEIPEMAYIDIPPYEYGLGYDQDVPNACTNESFAALEEQISNFGQTDDFWNWIVENNLIPVIQQAAQNQPLTLFLPRNEAVLQYQIFLSSLQQQEPGTLSDILLYHIVPGIAIQSKDIIDTQSYKTLTQNSQVSIFPGDPFAKIEADILANIIEPDVIQSCNLSMHVIGEMLKVKEIFEQRENTVNTPDVQNTQNVQICAENVFDAISQIPELSYVLKFMEKYKQAWFLRLNSSLTIFIPQKDQIQALQQFANLSASSISSEAEILRQLLEYHIVPNMALSQQEIRNMAVLETLSGDVLYPQGGAEGVVLRGNVNSSVIIKEEYNTQQQQQSCKIALHIISKILQPVKFGERFESDPYASLAVEGARVVSSSFCQQQQQQQQQQQSISITADDSEVSKCIWRIANILQNSPLMDNIDRITVLAPNNNACSQLDTLLMQQSLQQDQRLMLQDEILSYHMIPNVLLTDIYLGTVGPNLQPLPTLNTAPLSINKKFGNVYFEGVEGKARIVKPDIQLDCDLVIHVIDDILIPFSQFPGSSTLTASVQTPSPIIVDSYSYTIPVPQTLPLAPLQQSPEPLPPTPLQQSPELTCSGICCYAYDIIQNHPELTSFRNMINFANLTDLFQNSIDVTVLAPRNDRIFEFLKSLNIPTLSDFPQQNLRRLVQYHVLEGVWPVRLLKDQLTLKSQLELEQSRKAEVLFLSNWEQLFPEQRTWFALGMLNNATLVETDLESGCAVVHIIDYPLLIPGL